MCGHKGHGTELVECTADHTAVECTVVDYTVAVRWDFAVPVAAVAAVVPVVPAAAAVPAATVVPVAAVVPAAAVVPVAAVVPAAAVVGVLAVPAAEY